MDKFPGIYKVIDPIDKIFPSFLLLILLIVVLFSAAVFFTGIGGIINPLQPTVEIGLVVQNESGSSLEGIELKYSYGDISGSLFTDSSGKINMNVPANAGLDVLIDELKLDGKSFEKYSETISTDESKTVQITLKEKVPQSLFDTTVLLFKNSNGEKIIGKSITALLNCSSGVQINPNIANDNGTGEIIVQKPKNCGTLHVKASLSGFNGTEKDVLSNSDILLFEPLTPDNPGPNAPLTGNLRVDVYGENQRILNNVSVDVKLVDSEGIEKTRQSTQDYGYVIFRNHPEGSYAVIVSDPKNDYATEQANAEIVAIKTTPIQVNLTKSIKATLRISVLDKSNNSRISNATVSVRLQQNGTLVAEQKTNATGDDIVIPFKDLMDVNVFAYHDEYLYNSIAVDKNQLDGQKTILLEKLTPENSGKIRVNVKDEDNLAVENASVRLRFYSSDLIAPFPQKTTDSSGEVLYSGGKKDEKYYAYVEKYPAYGDNKSSAQPIDVRKENLFNVTVVIGNSDVTVKAFDEENQPLAAGSTIAEFFDSLGQSIGSIPLTNGIGLKNFKADKAIYVVVRSPDFSTVQTELKQLIPSRAIIFEVKMHQKFSGNAPKVDLIGVYGRDGVAATKLSAGNLYNARFKLKVPDNGNFSEGGIHFRIGSNSSLENEAMEISQVNAPTSIVTRGLTFNPPLGETADLANTTNGEAKWINGVYGTFANSTDYDISIQFRVKASTPPETKLNLNYRVWGVKDSNYGRDPLDSELESSASTAAKQALYAQTYSKEYSEGKDPVCNAEAYCYWPETVLDKTDGLYLSESNPFTLKINGTYELNFYMINNSEKQNPTTDLYITNTDLSSLDETALQISSYDITNASNEQLASSNLALFKLPKLNGGNFSKGKVVKGKISFTAKTAKASIIEIKVVGEGREIFKRKIEFRTVSNNNLKLEIEPQKIYAFSPTTLNVSLYETRIGGNAPVNSALVRLTKTFADGTKNVETKDVDVYGKTSFGIPSVSPATKLFIEAEKMGYAPASEEIIVDENVMKAEPQSQSVQMDSRTKKEATLNEKLTNLTGNSLKISKAELLINSGGLLDETTMSNYLKTFENVSFNSQEQKDLPMIRVVLASNIEDLLHENKILNGTINLEISNSDSSKKWNILIPLEVKIKIGGAPDNGNCIVLQGTGIPIWRTVSTGNQAETTFQILNNCQITQEGAINSEPIGLDALFANISWSSTVMGNVELTITPSGNPTGERTETLKQQVDTIVWEDLPPSAQYTAKLTFTPLPDSEEFLGQKAQFNVNIFGKIMTSSGYVVVGSTPSTIASEIAITNLSTCLKFTSNTSEDNVISIEGDKETLTIDSTNCGQKDVQIQLCKGDSGCKGGTSIGGIDLSSTSFTLTPTNPVKNIDISRRDVPGAYGIGVHAMMPGVIPEFQKVNDIIATIMPRDQDGYFELSRYNFQLMGKDSRDSTTLTNKMFQETVKVKADLCAWGEATKNKDWTAETALAAGVGSLLLGGATVGLAAGTTIASGIGAALGVGASLAPLAGVGVVIIVVFILLSLLGIGKSCHDETAVHSLNDFVINLAGSDRNYNGETIPGDLKEIGLENLAAKISTAVNIDQRKVFDSGGKTVETIGVIFTNNGDINSEQPSYDIFNVTVTEHVHGNLSHVSSSAEYDVYCNNGNFAPYWIGPDACTGAFDRTYSQPFHVRIETAIQNDTQVNPVESGSATATTKENTEISENKGAFFSEKENNSKNEILQLQSATTPIEYCNNGAIVGKTGENALPKIKFNWNWSETDIPINACDEGNPNYFYCDATQFSIELSKKLHALDEFLSANNYSLSCPLNPENDRIESDTSSQMPYNSTNDISIGKVGLSQLSQSVSGNSATINAKVENKTGIKQNANVLVTVLGEAGNLDGGNKTCSIAISDIASNSSKSGSCSVNGLNLSEHPFTVIATISSTTAASQLDSTTLGMTFFNLESTENTCWLKNSTWSFNDNISVLELFINRDLENFGRFVTQENVNWTESIPDIETLRKIIRFRAYLIKDNYSDSFRKDFVDFYLKNSFYNAPAYFIGGQSGQLSKYFNDSESMAFSNRYYDDFRLGDAGLYGINLDILFSDSDWKFFDSQGNPKAKIAVLFSKIKRPFPNSPFYYLPINGNVGKENGRQNYGVSYSQLGGKPIIFTSDNGIVDSTAMPSSNALVSVSTKTTFDLKQTNSIASKRGNLLETIISKDLKNASMIFSPTYATPIILRLNKSETQMPFSASYQLRESSKAVSTGSTLAYWTGMGECKDFSGKQIKKVFNSTPDNEVKPNYSINWEKAVVGGNVYLKTVFFTPTDGKNYTLSKISPVTLSFQNPDSMESPSVELKGIENMQFNSMYSNSSVEKVIQLFNLVKEKKVCVSNSGLKSSFWWNPKKLNETMGAKTSVELTEAAIAPQGKCIR